ncbi:WXG100 family type VII secretion target [Streptomyces sioyaensis]|uniref:WXG100 family type VII secretion target n=1 Tax=Streptomyces sioyaensis TaxID=67364 RepID=UPI003D75AD11
MSAADKAKDIVQDLTGMWWPEGDEDQLREAARAWRTFADDVEDCTAACHKKAQDVIDNNKGAGIEAFDNFWRRYHGGGKGYLDDVATAARDMAKALDKFADQIAEAKKKIQHELEIAGAVIVAGTALALFTGGISEVAAGAATEAIVAAASTAGVAVSATIAEIAGTVLASAAIGGIEAITVDVVVAQGGRNLLGDQHGINLKEASTAGASGMLLGGLFGGAGATARAVGRAGGFKGLRIPRLGPMGSRGSGGHLPPFEEVKKAVAESKPQILSRRWPDDDGRYYATRVLAGGRADGQKVFAGHGYLERGAGEVTVPPGTRISFYVEDGELIPGLNGVAVEGGTYPASAVQTFEAGEKIPNYTLAPPEAKGAGGFTVYENSTTVSAEARLSDLLKPGMGDTHWAACREHAM